MRALTDRQREFARLAVEFPLMNRSLLVKKAGFSDASPVGMRVMAHKLLHSEKVLAAIAEESDKRLRVGGLIGLHGLIKMARDPKHPDHFKACQAMADRGGFHAKSEHNVNVVRTDRTGKAMMERIRALAAKHGLDPDKLLGVNAAEPLLIEGEVSR